jgi:multidrug efflux system outer membrane protein
MNVRRIAALASAFLLAGSGCMVGPDYERPATDLPNAYADSDTAAASAPLRADWWTLYNDATLNELVSSALERNADIRLAVARIEETDANLREANASFLPEVDLGAGGNRSRASSVTAVPVPASIPVLRNDLRLGLSTSFELDFWGRLRRGAEAVRAQALGSRYAKDVVALTLAGLTTQAYFSLRSLEAQIAVTRETLAAREESLGFVRARARGGVASDLDVSQAQGAHADTSAQLKDLQRQRSLTEHQLGALTGRSDLALPAGDLRKLPTPPLPPAGLPSSLLERRPDIRQAEQALISANAQIGIAKAAMLPTISLTGSYGRQSQALSTLMTDGATIWSAGFGLTLPIFDAGRYRARTDAAVAREHQALAGYQKAVETAFREVADALSSVQQAAAAEEDYQSRAEAARRTLRLARLRYDAGYSGYLEVLDAQRTANDAESALLRNRQLLLSATVDLMKALGGGWSAEQAMLKP